MGKNNDILYKRIVINRHISYHEVTSKMKNKLTNSFIESIKENIEDPIVDTADLVVSNLFEELQELPFIKYIVSTYKMIDNFRGRHQLAKLNNFIVAFNQGIHDEEELEEIKSKLEKENRKKEIYYICILIDRYLSIDNSTYLGKLYLAFLNEEITWDEFSIFAEMLDKLLKPDLEYLKKNKRITVCDNNIPSECLRLTGLGLMYDYQNDSPFIKNVNGNVRITEKSLKKVDSKEKIFQITPTGEKIISIFFKDRE